MSDPNLERAKQLELQIIGLLAEANTRAVELHRIYPWQKIDRFHDQVEAAIGTVLARIGARSLVDAETQLRPYTES